MDAHTKAQSLLDQKDDDYWKQFAIQQMQYTQIRLIYRPTYYTDVEPPGKRGTLSLTLPEFFDIKFTTKPYFKNIDGHKLYVRDYTFHNVLVSDVQSVIDSDDRFAQIGGTASEAFTMPVDPFLVVQRTGYACTGEAGWPPNSVDGEVMEV